MNPTNQEKREHIKNIINAMNTSYEYTWKGISGKYFIQLREFRSFILQVITLATAIMGVLILLFKVEGLIKYPIFIYISLAILAFIIIACLHSFKNQIENDLNGMLNLLDKYSNITDQITKQCNAYLMTNDDTSYTAAINTAETHMEKLQNNENAVRPKKSYIASIVTWGITIAIISSSLAFVNWDFLKQKINKDKSHITSQSSGSK